MTDEFEDSEVKEVFTADVITKDLIKDLKDGLSEKGTVNISDYSLTID